MRTIQFFMSGALLLAPTFSEAQIFEVSRPDSPRPTRGAAGGGISYGQPVGDFHDYVNQGFGFDGFFRWNADRSGILSLRVEGGFLGYGRETKRVPLSSTIGGRILVDLTTSNNIAWGGIGPQLTLPTPFLRPYITATAGFAYFFTESSVEGSSSDEEFASTTNYDDGTFAWGVGGGFLIPFRVRGGEMALDLGARYHGNGDVRYLRKGSIEDLPNGDIMINPIQSEANLVTYRIGLSVAIR